MARILLFLLFIITSVYGAESSLARYGRSEPGVLVKEYDMEGGRAYWQNGISIMGLPDAGADVMGFYDPARRLPLGFSGLYTPEPTYERYGLSLNASNGNIIFKQHYNPVDTPVTELLWERYGLGGNALRLNFNRQLLDSIIFTFGLGTNSVPQGDFFVYSDVVNQLYTGSLGRDSTTVPLAGRNLAYDAFHFAPAISWLFPHSSITLQSNFFIMNSEDATRYYFERDAGDGSIQATLFPYQEPYNIKGGSSFWGALWKYRPSPKWEISLNHRLANMDFTYSELDTASIYYKEDATETYSAQTGRAFILYKGILNPHIKVDYEYLRNEEQSLYQDRQLAMLGIRDTLWKVGIRGELGLQRNSSAFDDVDFAPAISGGFTLFLPWHLELNGDYQKDTRFPDMFETHITRAGRIAFPNADLKPEKRQRMETNITYKLSKKFFYTAGYRYEESQNAILPHWAVPKGMYASPLPADSAFRWDNADYKKFFLSNELFWRIGFELGNWDFYAEQGKVYLRDRTIAFPSRYYKGAVYWSNRFVEERLKVSIAFDADWFGDRWEYALINDTTAALVQVKKYLSLNFKAAMQIQTFTLYFRMDNMNHSLMMPESGYAPPGVRFAYGIEWKLED